MQEKKTKKNHFLNLKLKRFIASFLILVFLFNQNALLIKLFLPKAMASSNNQKIIHNGNIETRDEMGIMLILVDNSLLEDKKKYKSNSESKTLKERIFKFAENMQSRVTNSRSMVLGVDPNEDVYKISTALESLYYDGVSDDFLNSKNKNSNSIKKNKLKGIVLVGNVPIPVVKIDNITHPSIYPYTDFYRKQFIYNHKNNIFELNSDITDPSPEIWHSLIIPSSKDIEKGRQEIADFLYKNEQYTLKKGDYANFDKKIFYQDFKATNQYLNNNDFWAYKRSMKYLEETVFRRFNRHLLKAFVDEIAEDLEGDKALEDRHPIIDDYSLHIMSDTTTEFVIKKFLKNFAEGMQSYLSGLKNIIARTGRWDGSFDTMASLITIRDTYMQTILMAKNIELENLINNQINTVQNDISLPSKITIQTTKCNLDNEDCQEWKSFDFDAFLAGSPVKNLNQASQCYIIRGQESPSTASVLDNNSVLVKANRTFNPDTNVSVEDGETRDLKELPEYKAYGGCVANNAYEFTYKGDYRGPGNCHADEAYAPIFDIVGSKEINEDIEIIKSEDGKNIEKAYFDKNRAKETTDSNLLKDFKNPCDTSRMSFLQNPAPIEGWFSPVENNYEKSAYDDIVPLKLGELIREKVYAKMKENNEIQNPLNSLSINKALQKVYLGMIDTNNFSRNIINGLLNDQLIKFKINSSYKKINSLIVHREPSDFTLNNIKKFITPNIPADGIHYVDFNKNNNWYRYVYPDLFRIKALDKDELNTNLENIIKDKDEELNSLLGENKNLVSKFFEDNKELKDAILWRNLGIDQKHELIMNVLNTDIIKESDSYEALFLKADGNYDSINFAINGSHLSKAINSKSPEENNEGSETTNEDETTNKDTEASTENTSEDPSLLFSCSSSSSVEIWEWWDAVQCWLVEEASKIDNIFTMNNSCSSLATDSEEEEKSVFENPELVLDSSLYKADHIDLIIDEKVLRKNQKTHIKVKVFNKNNELLMGYLDDNLKFSSSNNNLISFEKNNIPVFTGEALNNIETNDKTGDVEITATIGDVKSNKIKISIVDNIEAKLSYIKNISDRLSYTLSVDLLSLKEDGSYLEKINNINTKIQLFSERSYDGLFANSGLVNIENGHGEIIFFANPASKNIDILANHPYYKSKSIHIEQEAGEAKKLFIESPKYLNINSDVKLNLYALDSNSIKVNNFQGNVKVRISDETSSFASILANTNNISGSSKISDTKNLIKNNLNGSSLSESNIDFNGESAKIHLKTKGETGYVKIIAEAENMEAYSIEIPIKAKISSEEWANKDRTALFSTFVGFPAGNFLKENYFAGKDLFSGKTQAVFAFQNSKKIKPLSIIHSNFNVENFDSSYVVNTQIKDSNIFLEIFNKRKNKLIFSSSRKLNVSNLFLWNELTDIKDDSLYVNLLNNSYSVKQNLDSIEILNSENNKILEIKKDEIKIYDLNYKLKYDKENDLGLFALKLIAANGPVADIYINLKAESIKEENSYINSKLAYEINFDGISTNSPQSLVIYNPEESKNIEFSEEYGFENKDKFMLRFASSNVGEAVRWNMPYNAFLFGDPSIILYNDEISSLSYDNTIGEQIFKDPENTDVIDITNFDFNNDGIQDIALLMKDGRVRLMLGGNTNPIYKDKGDIAFMGDGALAIKSFDFLNDGYDDLVVATKDGRLAILSNNKEVISRTNKKIKTGKQVYQIEKEDMDNDGYDDLVTLDSRGDIRIFYNQSPNFNKFPVSPEDQIPENGVYIGNYGLSLKLDTNLNTDLKVRYDNINNPVPNPLASKTKLVSKRNNRTSNTDKSDTDTETKNNPFGLKSVEKPEKVDFSELSNLSNSHSTVSDAEAKEFMNALSEKQKEERKTDTSSSLPWKDGDNSESYFANIIDLNNSNAVFNNGILFESSKTAINKDRPDEANLDIKDNILYTIKIKANKNISNFVLADTIPDTFDLKQDSISCVSGNCNNLKSEQKDIYLFFSNINLSANKEVVISYEVELKTTPKSLLLLKKLDNSIELEASGHKHALFNFYANNDAYTDILVSPPYNNTGQLFAHYSVAPRGYKIASTVKKENKIANIMSEHDECMLALDKLKTDMSSVDPSSPNFSPPPANFMDEVNEKCGLNKAQDLINGDSTTTPEQCAQNPDLCVNSSVSDIADTVNNMACSGGGCFPTPVNFSFLTPQSIIPIAMPVLAFPATLITPPVGPVPTPGSLGMFPMPMGNTTVPGAFNSLVRLYTAPTLTGGIGVSVCWGPYVGDLPVPPPMFPLPYPPPIGNCMTIALPMGMAPPCKAIETLITNLMEGANSIVSDANSGIAAVNNSNLPLEIDSSSESSSAGGMEISLATNLGSAHSFEPPIKSTSNTHVSSFDSIGGVIASWMDRQMVEILNKLLKLPTIKIIAPNPNTIFLDDLEDFEKELKTFTNSNKPLSGFKTIDVNNTDKDNGYLSFKDNFQVLSQLENKASVLNNNFLEQIYTLVDAMPLLKLNEKNINFKIPYISFSQIIDLENDFHKILFAAQRKSLKYKDKFEEYANICPDWSDNSKTADCISARVLNSFNLNLDKFISSIEKNIEVLQSYKALPRKLIGFKKDLAKYIEQISCYIDSWANNFAGYFAKIQNQIEGYVEIFLTIPLIIEQVHKLIDVFSNFEDSCDICTNERFANFGWFSLLGLIIPDIPIIKFPSWPDLTLDLSDVTLELNVDVPIIHFIVDQITIPKIPIDFIYELPDLPAPSDLNLLASIPDVPILPSLPDIPTLPSLPDIPTIELPSLPPPPKLPDLGASFELITPIMELILQSWCLIKKSFAPVPEGYLSDDIALLTNRPAYQIPLDLLKPKIQDISPIDTGFNELKINSHVYLGVNISLIVDKVSNIATYWNNLNSDFAGIINHSIQVANIIINNTLNNLSEEAQNTLNNLSEEAQNTLNNLSKESGFSDFLVSILSIWDSLSDLIPIKPDEIINKIEDIYNLVQLIKSYSKYNEKSLNEISDLSTIFMKDNMEDVNKKYIEGFLKIKLVAEKDGKISSENLSNFFNDNIVRWIFVLSNPIQCANVIKILLDFLEENNINDSSIQDTLNAFSSCSTNLKNIALNSNDLSKADINNACSDLLNLKSSVENSDISEGNSEDLLNKKLGNLQSNNLKNTILSSFKDFRSIISKANKHQISYKELAKYYNIKESDIPKIPDIINPIKNLKLSLLAYSNEIKNEVEKIQSSNDALAYFQNQAEKKSRYTLASKKLHNDIDNTYVIKVEKPKLLAQAKTVSTSLKNTNTNLKINKVKNYNDSVCKGICLFDPESSHTVPAMPYVNNTSLVKMAFIPSSIKNKSHLVYSDEDTVFLKRNLSVPSNITKNIAPKFKKIIFSIEDISMDNYEESINMLKSTLTENSIANFEWKKINNPNLYGIGMELEKSPLAYGLSERELPTLTIILLPLSKTGQMPLVTVGGNKVPYNTLISSYESKEEAKERFSVNARNFIGSSDMVLFNELGNIPIKLNKNKAVLFDVYNEDSYSLKIKNGFYQIKTVWFDKFARTSNYNKNELLAPQIYVNAISPYQIPLKTKFEFPIYEEGEISASSIFMDLSSSYKYYWDLNRDGIPDESGDILKIHKQSAPKDFKLDLIASVDIEDPYFERYVKTIDVSIYTPKISLDKEALGKLKIQGSMKAKETYHSLKDMPFSLFRKRLGVWKNLGIIKHMENKASDPDISDKFDYKDNYYAINDAGDYKIKNFSKGPSDVVVKDSNQENIARIKLNNGQVVIEDNKYKALAIPASKDLPTRIVIKKLDEDDIVANVYYVSDSDSDVMILNEALNQDNVYPIGVSIGDRDSSDSIVAENIPGYAESYPGGAAIFDKESQKNIALINSNGSIRLMMYGYGLKIKNLGQTDEKPIFTITGRNNEDLYDVFISADFSKLKINYDEIWDNLEAEIAYIKTTVKSMFASSKPSIPNSPFSDLDKNDPYYRQILDLYNRNIIKGYDDGTFKSSAKITRAEFVKIALGATKCFDCSDPSETIENKYNSINPFPDVILPSWYYYCISIAKEIGMVFGYGDGYFRPERNISRAEAVAILLRQSDINLDKIPDDYFDDIPNYAWYKDYIFTAVNIGLITVNNNMVSPDEQISRGEFAFMASTILNTKDCKMVDSDGDLMPDWWEADNNLDPLFDGDAVLDNDFDGLNNLDEYKNGSDPNKDDSNKNDSNKDDSNKDDSNKDLQDKIDTCIYKDNLNQKDTDNDGIIDPCDDDIDNDGIKNPIGLFDDNGLIDPIKAKNSDDNCIFDVNPKQEDDDSDGVGNLCFPIDQCPAIPEDLDGYHDLDGCPEVFDDLDKTIPNNYNVPGVYVNQGPACSFLDYDADLINGDKIMTAIVDTEMHDVIYSSSNVETFNYE